MGQYRQSLITFLFLIASASAVGELQPPTSDHVETAISTATEIRDRHFLKGALPDFSEGIHESFLDRVDPEKLYLTEKDRAEIERYRTLHGQWIGEGRLDAAWDIFQRVHQRRLELIETALNNFQNRVERVGDSNFDRFVQEDLESRIKDGVSRDEAREKLARDLERSLDWSKSVTNHQLVELYLDSAVKAFDPHSSYMSEQTFKEFMIHITGSLEGIGVTLTPQEGYLEIREVMPNGGAAEQGFLKPGHRIVGISQDGVSFVDVEKIASDRALQLIRGEAGTEVFLRVRTKEGKPPTIIKIPRRRVALEDSRASGSIARVNLGNGTVHEYGIIDIPSFYSDHQNKVSVAQDVFEILQKMRKSGRPIRGLVVDLRGNGGGSLGEVINMLGMFVGPLPAVQVSDSAKKRVGQWSQPQIPQIYTGPLLTLIDKRSASASEIFAGTIQDYGRGPVVGDSTSFGKGSVQTFFPLQPESRGSLKLTIQGFYRPSGRTTQHRGVSADIVFPSGWDQGRIGEATLENSLKFPDIEPAAKVLNSHLSPEVLEMLKRGHLDRSQQVAELKSLYDQVLSFRQRSEDPSVPNPTREEAKQLAELGGLGKSSDMGKEAAKGFGEDVYTFEVLRIFNDYIRALESQGIREVKPEALVIPPNPKIISGGGLLEKIEMAENEARQRPQLPKAKGPCPFNRLN